MGSPVCVAGVAVFVRTRTSGDPSSPSLMFGWMQAVTSGDPPPTPASGW